MKICIAKKTSIGRENTTILRANTKRKGYYKGNQYILTLSLFILLSLNFFTLNGQSLKDLSFGTDSTLDILTWNIEHFPKNSNTTINYVTEIIENLNVDIIAIQEVSNVDSFNTMLDNLDGYNGYLESVYFRGLAYIYKTDVIQINDIYEIYTTSEYWKYFPRNPMVMDFEYNGQRFIIINNHFKCCGDGYLDLNNEDDEETRRFNASRLLKEYIDTHFSNENVFLVGDFNDRLTDGVENNIFQNFIDDTANFLFTDIDIANDSNSNWSYPTWPSHLDHILITNELFDAFQNQNSSIETIKIEEYLTNGWSEYDTNITDHRPVGLKLFTENTLGTDEINGFNTSFNSYPNPFKSEITFTFKNSKNIEKIHIYTIDGQKITTIDVALGQKKVKWNSGKLKNGIYFAKLISNNKLVVTKKLILMK